MDTLDDRLQARLARLEAGQPLETCLLGLPEAEAALLRQAAQLRGLAAPEPNPALAARQRREYLRAAASWREPAAPARPARGWVLPGLTLAGVSALLLCVFVPLSLAALAWLRGPGLGLPVALDAPAATPDAHSESAAAAPTPPATSAPAAASADKPPDAQSAVLRDARGLVEVQTGEGPWQAADTEQVVRAGQRLRTGPMSSVTLVFYDGSRAELGPRAELSVDALDAPAAGARVVALTQWLGESSHVVTASADPGSRYVVESPNGFGTAKGTIFHVQVTPALLVRFDVDEGAVDVTHEDVTVLVVAGQSTIVRAQQPPAAPAFLISGQGAVQSLGETWLIAGREFVTHPNTVVFGEPRVGDWVRFEGRLIASGLRVLDKIVLLRRAAGPDFTLAGRLDVVGASEWVVAGRSLRVDAATRLDPGLTVGAWVEASGGISADGVWWASRIRPAAEPGAALTFGFAGVVQATAATHWVVSGVTVTVEAATTLEAGLAPGAAVWVEGRMLEDGRWLAASLRRLAPGEGAFEIVGVLDSLEPLTVAGIRLVTAAWTEIDPDLAAGDRVRAEGRLLDDGTWLVEAVKRLDDEAAAAFEFVGTLDSLDPWVVAGIALSVTTATEIEAGLAAGDRVRVEGVILADGTWLASEIKRPNDGLGCLELRGVVARVEAAHFVLNDGLVIDLAGAAVEGQLAPGAVVVIYGCVDGAGRFVADTIVVIYRLPEVPPTPGLTPTPWPTRPPAEGDKVTVCHRPPGNPRNAHTISVGAPALPAHLAHGDTLGACP